MSQSVRDPIWGTPAACLWDYVEVCSRNACEYYSPRCGGKYMLPERTRCMYFPEDNRRYSLKPNEKRLLTSWLIEQRRNGIECPVITNKVVEDMKQRSPMPVVDRADAILKYIQLRAQTLGQSIAYSSDTRIEDDLRKGKRFDEILRSNEYEVYWNLLAYSESSDHKELEYLLEYLRKHDWFEYKNSASSPETSCLLTVEGHARLAEIQAAKTDSSKGFMAMWFHDSMNDAWENGFEPGIKQAGYEPMRIDKKQHSNKIDDEIVAEIRRARFVVADLTHGDNGVRGGVYYEAGFAHGLDIPVIFTCREGCSENTHFDIRQYNCIRWKDEDLEKLQKDLTNRITAIIGDGPGRAAN